MKKRDIESRQRLLRGLVDQCQSGAQLLGDKGHERPWPSWLACGSAQSPASCSWQTKCPQQLPAQSAGSIVVTLPADLSAQQREVLLEALGRLEHPIQVDEAVPPTEDVGGSRPPGTSTAETRRNPHNLFRRRFHGLIALSRKHLAVEKAHRPLRWDRDQQDVQSL